MPNSTSRQQSMTDTAFRKRKLDLDLQNERDRYLLRQAEIVRRLDVQSAIKDDATIDRNETDKAAEQYQRLLEQYAAEKKAFKDRELDLKIAFYDVEAQALGQAKLFPSEHKENPLTTVSHRNSTGLVKPQKKVLPIRQHQSLDGNFTAIQNTISQPQQLPLSTWHAVNETPEVRNLRKDLIGTADRRPTRDGLVKSNKNGWWYLDDNPCVVQHRAVDSEEKWYLIRCGICKTTKSRDGESIRGVSSLQTHITSRPEASISVWNLPEK